MADARTASGQADASCATHEPRPVGSPVFHALDALGDPQSVHTATATAEGITAVVVHPPLGGPFAGRSTALLLGAEARVDDRVLRREVGLVTGRDPRDAGQASTAAMTELAALRSALTAAEDYAACRDQARSLGEPFRRVPAEEVLARTLAGSLLWVHRAQGSAEIQGAIRLADEFGHRLVVAAAAAPAIVEMADALAERAIPVLLGPGTSANDGAADALHRAGVELALVVWPDLSGPSAPPATHPRLIDWARRAVVAGLDPAAALAAITRVPAEMMGLGSRCGVLEPGRSADLTVWSGHPLDAGSQVLRVLVAGVEVFRAPSVRPLPESAALR